MKQEEYIKTIAYNGHMINIGVDDAGQQYFLEYMDDYNNLVEIGCGAYNTDYISTIERLFGSPEQCVTFKSTPVCYHIFAHGYCSRCPNNAFLTTKNKQ